MDSRASLFVLSPVASKEVQNFVSSLQSELLESSIDYYREHGRRLRRKRARPAGANASVSISASTQMERTGTGTPHVMLNNAALNVRYEFKAATFAEFRSEIEVALKHYEDCYAALLELFVRPASPNNPHPFILARTKRWAEARVLADCIIVKICKMYLYAGNSELSVQTYREHIRRLSRISAEKWNMDESSFEYWSWESKQHKIFADLLESAISAGFQLPQTPAPAPVSTLQSRAIAQHVPAQALQHPGAYHLKAGLAAELRQRLFRQALQDYERSYSAAMTDPAIEEPPKLSAALAHERNAPHSEQIIELYTKAYDYYKASKGVRMTLQLAYLIARVHHDTHTFETALRFDQRIAKTYRRERWFDILSSILKRDETALYKQITSLSPDRQATLEDRAAGNGDQTETSQEALMERVRGGLQACMECLSLAQSSQANLHDYAACVNAIGRFWEAMRELPISDNLETPVIELSSKDSELPVHVNCVFWNDKADLGSQLPFQVTFSSKAVTEGAFDAVAFESIALHFSDEREPFIVENGNMSQIPGVTIKPGQPRASGSIRNILRDGTITSSITSALAQTVSVSQVRAAKDEHAERCMQVAKVTVALAVSGWRLALHLYPSISHPTWRCEPSEDSQIASQASSLTSPQFANSCR